MGRYADTTDYSEAENRLWVLLTERQGTVFHTAKGLPFTYEIKGNEILFSRKAKFVTRATVNRAYRRMTEETVTGSKQLNVFGASYLFPLLKTVPTDQLQDNREPITLVRPTAAQKDAALAFKQSFFDAGETVIDGSERLDLLDSYEDWLAFVTRNAEGQNGIVTDTYFAVDPDGEIVGIIDFRHELNDFFRDFGHCGYSVAPRARKKGYATEMLGKIVRQARDDGLAKLQLAALRSNIPSVRTIEKNGGRVVRTFDFYGQPADVFEIDLS